MTEPREVYPGGGTGPPEPELPFDPDPAHADPADETDNPADAGPGCGYDDPDAGELPADIPETDEVWPPDEGGDS